MKRVLAIALIVTTFLSCDKINNVIQPNRELYEITDGFVSSLKTLNSYGMLDGMDYAMHTKDGAYTVFPIGRLINVKIEKSDANYESLKTELKDHYQNNPNVNDVYICQGGTIMIDCRN